MRTVCLISMLIMVGCAGAGKRAPQPAPVSEPAEATAQTPSAVPTSGTPAPEPENRSTPVPVTATSSSSADRQLEARMAQAEQGSIDVAATLRQASRLAESGSSDQAAELYGRVVGAANAQREAIATAATGLYRIGDFAGAVRAFARLGSFRRGEEDLRYYDAVSLFETGQYAQASIELACALPYIQVTDDVTRYRTKIERMADRPGTP